MTNIKITCPDCGRIISVNIATIDVLKARIAQLEAEVKKLTVANPFDSIFGGRFGK